MKELHLAHHVHGETGHFGVTSFVVDRAFGTYCAEARNRPRSPRAFNLAHDRAEAARFPWVARLTSKPPRNSPGERA
jgi:sterol desaturase/sphingolipid hydroxylase (fatty acid hydroxylase superfamily)